MVVEEIEEVAVGLEMCPILSETAWDEVRAYKEH